MHGLIDIQFLDHLLTLFNILLICAGIWGYIFLSIDFYVGVSLPYSIEGTYRHSNHRETFKIHLTGGGSRLVVVLRACGALRRAKTTVRRCAGSSRRGALPDGASHTLPE